MRFFKNKAMISWDLTRRDGLPYGPKTHSAACLRAIEKEKDPTLRRFFIQSGFCCTSLLCFAHISGDCIKERDESPVINLDKLRKR